MWSVDSLGWKGLTATQICNRVLSSMSAASNGGNGYIVLFHVGAQSVDAKALSCITNTFKVPGVHLRHSFPSNRHLITHSDAARPQLQQS